MTERTHTRVHSVLFGIALVSVVWAVVVTVTGGGDIDVAGLVLKSHEPIRPLLVGFGACVWLALSTDGSFPFAALRWSNLSVRSSRAIVLAMSAAAVAMGIICSSKVAVGADAYGYMSQAHMWMAGRLAFVQSWQSQLPWPFVPRLFAPLGYMPGVQPDSIVPTYPPGLPVLLALAGFAGGERAMYVLVPAAGGLTVLATCWLAIELGANRPQATTAAWLMFTSPIFIFMLMPAMSDVPATAAWTLAWVFALRSVRNVRYGFLAGVSVAIAIAIRPNLAPLALAIVWAMCGGRDATWRYRSARIGVFAAATVPAGVGLAMLNRIWYGSPLRSGYGDLGALFSVGNIPHNLVWYAGQCARTELFVALGFVALLVTPRRTLGPKSDRRVIQAAVIYTLTILGLYLPYIRFHEWMFLRFFLPVMPLVAIASAGALHGVAARPGRLVSLAVAFSILALGMIRFHTARELGAFAEWRGDRDYAAAAATTAAATNANSVVFTLIHSGSVRYYGSRISARFDALPADALDSTVGWLSERGVSSYVLLAPWERPEFESRFEGQESAKNLQMHIRATFAGENDHTLYGLERTEAATSRTVHSAEVDVVSLHYAVPAPLIFRDPTDR